MLRLDADAKRMLPGLWASAQVLERHNDASRTPLPDARSILDPSWNLDTLKDHPTAAGFRRICWTVGIDPTKNRPSGEALARRVMNGNPWPKIHPLVDAYNLASAATLVPLGAYDLDHLTPPLTIRPARPGDVFHGIGRQSEPVDPKRVVYASADTTVCGVLLWRDSVPSRIRPDTKRALVMAVGAEAVPAALGLAAVRRAAELAGRVGFRPAGDIVYVEA